MKKDIRHLKKLESIGKIDGDIGFLLNGKYEIWIDIKRDNYTIYNTQTGGDSPEYVFNIASRLLRMF